VTLEKVMINNKQTNRVASPGEVVSVDNQFLIPNKKKKGHNWACFVQSLRHLGYQVEYKMLAASSFGAPTTRERLFLIARRDGLPMSGRNTHNTLQCQQFQLLMYHDCHREAETARHTG